ncbi:glycosyltransferase family 2 protein [Desulfotomaculum nigrificans]|uniref:glycosyltransferase family 2 protein n=1 Tax=Desulfotomaculum nigrificans TaxID=1565 RepID=UPI0001FADE60|nr:glycosyltransferase family 2 protein [Desulfotomaculum nigrificans]
MISLCMIIKNEEHNLPRCLSSAKDCVDEIIVVDTGSDDNSVEIAKQFGAKVFFYQWDDDFAAARNFSISKATGDWVIYLDADEELEPDCASRFRALAENPEVEGYYFHINNLCDNDDALRHINVRMFRNKPQYRFDGQLHEQILNAIQDSNPGHQSPVVDSGITILHYGYLYSEFLAKNKAQRNYRINKRLVDQWPDNPFYLYTLGCSCINLGNLTEATDYFRKALKYIDFRATYAPSVFISLISCLIRTGELDEAMEQIHRCQQQFPDYVDIYFVEGELAARLGLVEKARVCFEKCLSLGEQVQGKFTTKTGVGSFRPMFELAQLYQAQGDLEKAIHYQLQGIKYKDDISQYVTLARLLKTYLKDDVRLLSILRELCQQKDKVKECLTLGQILYDIGAYDLAIRLLDEAPAGPGEIAYLKAQCLLKINGYREAIETLKQIKPGSQLYQNSLPSLVLAHWLATPPLDAAGLLRSGNRQHGEAYETFLCINEHLFKRHPETKIDANSKAFKKLVDQLISLNQAELLVQILTLGGLATPYSKVWYLTQPPMNPTKLELAAKLALLELKQGSRQPDYPYVLGWYFYDHNELASAQQMLLQAIKLNPADRYKKLLKETYRKQCLNMVKTALQHYPDNPKFNRWLIDIQKDRIQYAGLKGVH